MRFTILPQKNTSIDSNVSGKDYLTIDFDTKGKFSSFCEKYLVSLFSFLIPLSILLLFMNILGFAPFGSKCLFISSGLDKNLTILATLQNYIKDDLFSFLTLPSAVISEYLYLIIYYFMNPLHFIMLFMPISFSVSYLQILCVLEIALSGLTFSYYLQHRLYGHAYDTRDFSVLLFSCAYALSGYMLVQYSDFQFLGIATLFPILFYFYEKLLCQKQGKGFRLVLALCFYLQFYLTAMISIFLFVYLIIYRFSSEKHENLLSLGLRYLSNCMLSILYSAPVCISGFYILYSNNIKFSEKADFALNTGILSFLSQFFPANYASYFYSEQTHGTNLYCGLFILFLLPIFFFCKKYNFRQKLAVFITLVVLFCITNLSQFLYAMQLFSSDASQFNGYSFLFIFFILAICSDSLYEYKQTSLPYMLLSFLIPLSLFFITSVFSKNYSRTSSMTTTLVLLVLYLIYAILLLRKSIQKSSYLALVLLTSLLELSINAYTCLRDINVLAPDLQYVSRIAQTESIYDRTQNPFSFDINDFTLPYYFESEQNPFELSDTANIFEDQNSIAKKLGCNNALFSNADFTISCDNTADEISCKLSKNNIMTLRLTDQSEEESEDSVASIGENTPLTEATVTLHITPDKTGDLYLYIEDIVHIGQVEKGKPISYDFTTSIPNNVAANYWIFGAYLDQTVLSELGNTCAGVSPIENKSTLFSLASTLSMQSDGYLAVNIPYSRFVHASVDNISTKTSKNVCGTISIPVSAGTHMIRYTFVFTPLYIGILLCIISVVFTFLYRTKLLKKLFSLLVTPIFNVCDRLSVYCQKHKLGILSFCIPFGILLLSMIFASCTPFGSNTWLDGDGILLTLPMMRQRRYELLHGNFLYSWICGGGSNIYNSMPNTLLSFWLTLIPYSAMNPVLSIIEVIRISLCGVSMYFYLTRRLNSYRFYKKDIRILIFTSAYSLNAYILNMHCYFHWTNVLILFPLILLALDYMMLRKKIIPYILLLAIAIIADYNISLFICIFLVMWFFTYSYSSFIDFIKKGVVFALSSVLSAGMSFWILWALFSNLSISPYSTNDAIKPTLQFFQSFWDTFKQLFLFSDALFASEKNGAINLYCGIFIFVFFAISLFCSKIKKRNITKTLIMIFLVISSNNDLLSYLWNGMHYQIKVPNRYSFLLIFVIIDIASEAIQRIKTLSVKKLSLISIILVIFFTATYCLSNELPKAISMIATMIVLVMALILLWVHVLFPKYRFALRYCFVIFAIAELCISSLYNSRKSFTSLDLSNYSHAAATYVKENLLTDPTIERVGYIGPIANNVGMTNETASISQFNSYLTQYQYQSALLYGTTTASNNCEVVYNLTPFSNTISNTPYILLDQFTYSSYADIDHYEPVGYYGHSIILRNNMPLSIGFYLPSSIQEEIKTVTTSDAFANTLCKSFGISENIFTNQTLILPKGTAAEDTGNYIEVKEEKEASDEAVMHTVHFAATEDGYYYFKAEEYYSLGFLEKGHTYDFEIETPSDFGYICVYKEDVMQKLYNCLQSNSLQVTNSSNTGLSGTIHLPDDGIITFSIPYEPGWKVFIDDEEVDTLALGNAFLSVNASKGSHTISLRFFPTSLILGLSVTAVSWIIFLMLCCFLNHVKKQKDKI